MFCVESEESQSFNLHFVISAVISTVVATVLSTVVSIVFLGSQNLLRHVTTRLEPFYAPEYPDYTGIA